MTDEAIEPSQHVTGPHCPTAPVSEWMKGLEYNWTVNLSSGQPKLYEIADS